MKNGISIYLSAIFEAEAEAEVLAPPAFDIDGPLDFLLLVQRKQAKHLRAVISLASISSPA